MSDSGTPFEHRVRVVGEGWVISLDFRDATFIFAHGMASVTVQDLPAFGLPDFIDLRRLHRKGLITDTMFAKLKVFMFNFGHVSALNRTVHDEDQGFQRLMWTVFSKSHSDIKIRARRFLDVYHVITALSTNARLVSAAAKIAGIRLIRKHGKHSKATLTRNDAVTVVSPRKSTFFYMPE
jgi:hypothetical protein